MSAMMIAAVSFSDSFPNARLYIYIYIYIYMERVRTSTVAHLAGLLVTSKLKLVWETVFNMHEIKVGEGQQHGILRCNPDSTAT